MSDLVIAALRDEAAHAPGRVYVTGMGPRPMCDAIARLRPKRVLLIGFAGGLDLSLPAGHVLRVGRVLHGNDPPITLPGDATLLTVDAPALTPANKRALYERTGAAAVDMETYHVAAYCARQGIAFDALRAVSDPADAVLPPEAMRWVRPDGSRHTFAAVRYALTHPHRLPTLLRLGRDARRAARALGDTLAAWPSD